MYASVIADAVKEARTIPAGHIYAVLAGKMSLDTFESIIDTLVRANLVRRDSTGLITWVGPR
jgi:hypothetical protein